MAVVKFEHITKRFGEGKPAVDDLNLEIKDKEFMVLVGPSGCGKTTTLRMLAGLETPTSGRIFIDNKDVTAVAPKDRDIAMVFQSYALYPHMTVRDNLAFGLKNRELTSTEKLLVTISKFIIYLLLLGGLYAISIILDRMVFGGTQRIFFLSMLLAFLFGLIIYPELRNAISDISLNISGKFVTNIQEYKKKTDEINSRVVEVAKSLQIEELLDRKPKQLSGGQRQRVAVGRAIIRKPKVFLMDEPLSNLDAKLRNSTRAELAALQRRLETTTLYVTHDQIEAMTLGHRIAVMKEGKIEQLGTPKEIYGKPKTSFVAGFIGTPPMNLIHGTLSVENSTYSIIVDGKLSIPIPSDIPQKDYLEKHVGSKVIFGFRPEEARLNAEANLIDGRVVFSEAVGSTTNVHIELSPSSQVIVQLDGYNVIPVDTIVRIQIPSEKIHLFREEDGLRIEL
ncbi:MAG: ATP-binding cassette domain-containing protein [Methanobacteriota archaeon]|nr:MAG: ATP-binding cassette domain-containing protein [Euryarchaeota archaeon]